MNRCIPGIMLLVLVSGSIWPAGPQSHIRAAEAAYRRGNYEEALRHYQLAARSTHDPGFVAFNRAAVLVRLRRWQDAIVAYTQALEDADGTRRVLSLYGRGTARLILALEDPAQDKESLLIAASEDLQACVQASPEFDDARYHLSLALQLLSQVQKETQLVTKPQAAKPPGLNPLDRVSDSSYTSQLRAQVVKPVHHKTHGKPLVTTEVIQPGRGQLPAITKSPDAPPLPSDQAQTYLEMEWQRIMSARATRSVPLPQNISIRDW